MDIIQDRNRIYPYPFYETILQEGTYLNIRDKLSQLYPKIQDLRFVS